MLRLINIKKTDKYIEADYVPEQDGGTGHVKINLATMEREECTLAPGDRWGTYARMAFGGLKKTLKEEKEGYEIPEERPVVWY
ncbi:MAG: hypothetical protein K2J60_06200 [Acetatifactor sp.]|nr:hypothetical protein [Acetatifactor sp.]